MDNHRTMKLKFLMNASLCLLLILIALSKIEAQNAYVLNPEDIVMEENVIASSCTCFNHHHFTKPTRKVTPIINSSTDRDANERLTL